MQMVSLRPEIPMKVPLLDLSEQNQNLRPEIEAALGRVLDTNAFILGGEVQALEKELAEYCGTKYAIGCASGSDALLLALMALDVSAGDEVITTPYSFFATVSAVTRLGAVPGICRYRSGDIQSRYFAGRSEDHRKDKGHPARPSLRAVRRYGGLRKVAEKYGIPLVEDAAQAIGAEENGVARGRDERDRVL